MTTVSTYTLTPEMLLSYLNVAKEVTIQTLLEAGVLTKEQSDVYSQQHAIVFVDKDVTYGERVRNWFGHDKEENKDRMTFTMIKIVTTKS